MIFFSLQLCQAKAQTGREESHAPFKTVAAGPEYKASAFHQWLWGKNYRREWTTPVQVPIVRLDTMKGGLVPEKEGGGHQTKSLHLENKSGQEFTIRSVDKTLGKVLPDYFLGTFIEDIVNDEVSMSHPYGAATVPVMAKSAGIYHTTPEYIFVPKQKSLDSFSAEYGNRLYLFEQKPDGDWSNSHNLGNFKSIIDTEDLLEKLLDENNNVIDQFAFAKARLFDMVLGDWDRHEGQWDWGVTGKEDLVNYQPIPEDRDQVYYRVNGVLTKLFMGVAGLKYMQNFDTDIHDVRTFNYEERNLDRFFTNELTLEDWMRAAEQLQASLTDKTIETALKQLPAEVFPLSGQDITQKLKARREHVQEWANEYYHFIAKRVDITGTRENELFQIDRLNDTSTSVKVYADKTSPVPIYSRIFNSAETRELRLYGIGGNDRYFISGTGKAPIAIRIIGGPGRDSFSCQSANVKNVSVYDDANNVILLPHVVKLHLSNDTSIHRFRYDQLYRYDKKGLRPSVFYSNEDRLYVGLGYGITHYSWRKEPFASKQLLDLHYSLMEKAVSATYNLAVPRITGKWDFALLANFDAIRWTNFFGLGNETQFTVKDINYYRMRTRQLLFSPSGVYRAGNSSISLTGYLESVEIIKDEERYISKNFTNNYPALFTANTFAGGQLGYRFTKINDSVMPTKGVIFSIDGTALRNLSKSQSSERYSGYIQFFLPLSSNFTFSVKGGGATLTGDPLFYQYASIGGPTLRGFRRDRFWGKTVFYNTNDLRFVTNASTSFYKGKAGFLLFFDNGRVWMPGEISDIWHTGYGGGVTLAPFNRISGDVTYGRSTDGGLIQIRINKYF